MELNTNATLSIGELARMISRLSKKELKLLERELSLEDKILKKRLADVKKKKVKLLSRQEVF